MKDWEVIHEMDDEGLITCYANEFDGQFFWATLFLDGWHAETRDNSQVYAETRTLKILKTAKGAMRWVENNYGSYLYNRKES